MPLSMVVKLQKANVLAFKNLSFFQEQLAISIFLFNKDDAFFKPCITVKIYKDFSAK